MKKRINIFKPTGSEMYWATVEHGAILFQRESRRSIVAAVKARGYTYDRRVGEWVKWL